MSNPQWDELITTPASYFERRSITLRELGLQRAPNDSGTLIDGRKPVDHRGGASQIKINYYAE